MQTLPFLPGTAAFLFRETAENFLDYGVKFHYNIQSYGYFLLRKDFCLWQRNIKSQACVFLTWKRN